MENFNEVLLPKGDAVAESSKVLHVRENNWKPEDPKFAPRPRQLKKHFCQRGGPGSSRLAREAVASLIYWMSWFCVVLATHVFEAKFQAHFSTDHGPIFKTEYLFCRAQQRSSPTARANFIHYLQFQWGSHQSPLQIPEKINPSKILYDNFFRRVRFGNFTTWWHK